MSSHIKLGSNTGTDLVNMQGSTLEWSFEQESVVNIVTDGISQGLEVSAKDFDDCFTLLVTDCDSQSDLIGMIISDAYRHATTPHDKLRIIGFLLINHPDIAESLIRSDSPMRDLLGDETIQSLTDIINIPDSVGKIEGLLNLLTERFGIMPKSDMSALQGANKREGETSTATPADPELDYIIGTENVDRLKALIANAVENGTLPQLNDRLRAYPPEVILPLLSALLTDPQVDTASFLLSQEFSSGESQESVLMGSGGSDELTGELHEMDSDALEQLLLSPVSPTTFSQSYFPPAFCSHMMGLLA